MNVRWPGADARRRLTGSLVLSVAAATLAAAVCGHPWALAAALVAAGIVQAPLMACCYVLVPLFVRTRVSEAFGWLTSAVVGGIAIGTALAGGLVDGHGAAAGFAIGVVAPLLALALVRGPLARASPLP
jgi:MFS family permease